MQETSKIHTSNLVWILHQLHHMYIYFLFLFLA